MNETTLFIIYSIQIGVLSIVNFIPAISKYLGLYTPQKVFLLASSFLMIILFYFMRSFIVDGDRTHIILFTIFYTGWYYLTKLSVNKIMGYNISINNLI